MRISIFHVSFLIIGGIACLFNIMIGNLFSHIGKTGAVIRIITSILWIICGMGFLIFIIMVLLQLKWRKVVLAGKFFFIALIFFSFLFLLTGVVGLFKVNQEKNSKVIEVEVRSCEIIHYTYRNNYYIVRGIPVDGKKTEFMFTGKDRKIIEDALKRGINNFRITYYQNSGRMIAVKELLY